MFFIDIELKGDFISGTEGNVTNNCIDEMNIEWQTNIPTKPKFRTYGFIQVPERSINSSSRRSN